MQTDAITFSGTDFDWGTLLKQSQYTFDDQGRMTGASSTDNTGTPTTTLTTFTYDPTGIRTGQTISQTVGSTTTNTTITYLYDANNPTGYQQILEETTTTGSTTTKKTYTLGLDVIAQHDPTNGTLTLLYDGHGSTRAVMAANGTVVQRYAYDAYGNQLSATGLTIAASALTSLLYSGELFDRNLGMQYLRARYYAFSKGTFTSLDPDRRSLHEYTYGIDNPIAATDPTGRFSITEMVVNVALSSIISSVLAPVIKPAMKQLAQALIPSWALSLIDHSAPNVAIFGAGASGSADIADTPFALSGELALEGVFSLRTHSSAAFLGATLRGSLSTGGDNMPQASVFGGLGWNVENSEAYGELKFGLTFPFTALPANAQEKLLVLFSNFVASNVGTGWENIKAFTAPLNDAGLTDEITSEYGDKILDFTKSILGILDRTEVTLLTNSGHDELEAIVSYNATGEVESYGRIGINVTGATQLYPNRNVDF
jgi:RHS repeat-associated protein